MKKSLSKRLVFGTPTGWAGLYGFFLLTFFILWVPSTGYSSIVLPKHRLWVGATGLFLLGLVPLVLLQRRAGRLEFRPVACAGPPAPLPGSRPSGPVLPLRSRFLLSKRRLAGKPAARGFFDSVFVPGRVLLHGSMG